MKPETQLTGPFRAPRSGGKAKQLVVLLHGWGADGPNLIDLGDVLGQMLPDAHFIAPNAPYPCEANPFGYQWFSLMDRTPANLQAGVENASAIVNQFLDAQLASLNLDNSKLALVGFSQGTMTGLHVALRRTPQVAAVVGFSGSLLSAEVKVKPPICLIHGDRDDVVPYAALGHAESTLRQQGALVEAHTRRGLGHSIDMEGLKIAAEFLVKKLG